jgi:uncharacterized phage protein (TIGR02218 family)
MPSAAMLTHLQQNVTFLVPIWKMTAIDTTVAAYCAHTRNLTFDSVNYTAAPVEPSRFTQTLGVLEANHVELFGVLDTVVTEQDIQGGKWKNAKIVFEYIAYDPATGAASATVTGSVGKMRGQAGKFTINNGTFRVEFRSLSDLLNQEIGALTSPISRQRNLIDLVGAGAIGTYTFARNVTAAPDRRNFTVDGAAQANNYFRYGKVTFTSGANNGRSMEIKSSTGNVIELHLPMLSDIAIGNTVSLIAGWDGSREMARDKFGAAENGDYEPDLPGLQAVIRYPE